MFLHRSYLHRDISTRVNSLKDCFRDNAVLKYLFGSRQLSRVLDTPTSISLQKPVTKIIGFIV